MGGEFCLALHSGAALEVWAGLLSPTIKGQRWAVALVNRSPSSDTIDLRFDRLPDLDSVGLSISDVIDATFTVQDVWSSANHTAVQGVYSTQVGAHDTALLIVTMI